MKMNNQNKETRFFCESNVVHQRAIQEGDKRFIEGIAARFNHKSRLINDWDGTYFEIIEDRAFDSVLAAPDADVIHTYNHDPNRLLARFTRTNGEVSQNTLELTVDEVGLNYRFEVPNTPTGDEVFELVKRGDLNESSFVFSVRSDGQSWHENSEGELIRTISEFSGLYDTSTVRKGAYSKTDAEVAHRHFENTELFKSRKKEEDETEPDEAAIEAAEQQFRTESELDSMTIQLLELKN
jgi:HK97 family phage prohead protease